MGDGVFNIAKGRTVEYYNRIESNDPANSAFIVTLWTGTITDAVLKDLDDIAAIEASALSEAVFASYARKVLTDTELAALPAPDDTNDRYDIDIDDQTWLAATAGASLTRLIIGYDSDTTGGTDANIIPCTYYDFVVTTDGTDVTAQVDAAGFFRAT